MGTDEFILPHANAVRQGAPVGERYPSSVHAAFAEVRAGVGVLPGAKLRKAVIANRQHRVQSRMTWPGTVNRTMLASQFACHELKSPERWAGIDIEWNAAEGPALPTADGLRTNDELRRLRWDGFRRQVDARLRYISDQPCPTVSPSVRPRM